MVKLEKSTVHVYLAPFLGVHAQIQWSKFHDTRLIGEGGHLNAYKFENTINFRNNAYNILDME